MTNNITFNFRLSSELMEATKQHASVIDRTPGWIAREALKAYLPKPAKKPRK